MDGVLPTELMKSYRDRLESDLGFVAKSRAMKLLKDEVSEYGADKKIITILGAEGTGRKTFAKAIHLASSDWWRPFLEADLTGINDENALKFLLGHKEDHFFAQTEFKPGLVSMADRTTLCLKNFDRYSKKVQREVAKICLDRSYMPIGGAENFSAECRFILTIQNRPSELVRTLQVEEGVKKILEEKLISIAPLSKRKEDIVPLAEKFVRECCQQFSGPIKKFSKETERWLKKAPWNRNIGQLKRSIYLACINTSDGLLEPSHFALAHDGNLDSYQEKQLDELSIESLIELKLESFLGRLGDFEAMDLYEAIMDRVEEPLLRLVLNYSKGNQITASRILGVNRNTLRSKLTKYNVKVHRDGKIR